MFFSAPTYSKTELKHENYSHENLIRPRQEKLINPNFSDLILKTEITLINKKLAIVRNQFGAMKPTGRPEIQLISTLNKQQMLNRMLG